MTIYLLRKVFLPLLVLAPRIRVLRASDICMPLTCLSQKHAASSGFHFPKKALSIFGKKYPWGRSN